MTQRVPPSPLNVRVDTQVGDLYLSLSVDNGRLASVEDLHRQLVEGALLGKCEREARQLIEILSEVSDAGALAALSVPGFVELVGLLGGALQQRGSSPSELDEASTDGPQALEQAE